MSDRLIKIVARTGVASRRNSEAIIRAGRVSVDNTVVNDPFIMPNKNAKITVDGKTIIRNPIKIYVKMYKPKGVITSVKDPEGRETVLDIVKGKFSEQLFPIGRLDYNSEGLLLLTNDGDFAQALIHPSAAIQRVYDVKVKGVVSERHLSMLSPTFTLDKDVINTEIFSVTPSEKRTNTWIRMGIFEGKNREIRRIFEKMGFLVAKLCRLRIGEIELGDLAPGESKPLTKPEIESILKRDHQAIAQALHDAEKHQQTSPEPTRPVKTKSKTAPTQPIRRSEPRHPAVLVKKKPAQDTGKPNRKAPTAKPSEGAGKKKTLKPAQRAVVPGAKKSTYVK